MICSMRNRVSSQLFMQLFESRKLFFYRNLIERNRGWVICKIPLSLKKLVLNSYLRTLNSFIKAGRRYMQILFENMRIARVE